MTILKKDVIAILSERVNTKSVKNRRSSTFPPGPDKKSVLVELCTRPDKNNLLVKL